MRGGCWRQHETLSKRQKPTPPFTRPLARRYHPPVILGHRPNLLRHIRRIGVVLIVYSSSSQWITAENRQQDASRSSKSRAAICGRHGWPPADPAARYGRAAGRLSIAGAEWRLPRRLVGHTLSVTPVQGPESASTLPAGGDHQRAASHNSQICAERARHPGRVWVGGGNPHLSRRRPGLLHPTCGGSGPKATCVAGVRSAEMCAGARPPSTLSRQARSRRVAVVAARCPGWLSGGYRCVHGGRGSLANGERDVSEGKRVWMGCRKGRSRQTVRNRAFATFFQQASEEPRLPS